MNTEIQITDIDEDLNKQAIMNLKPKISINSSKLSLDSSCSTEDLSIMLLKEIQRLILVEDEFRVLKDDVEILKKSNDELITELKCLKKSEQDLRLALIDMIDLNTEIAGRL